VGSPGRVWQVMGRGKVYIILKNEVRPYSTGSSVELPS